MTLYSFNGLYQLPLNCAMRRLESFIDAIVGKRLTYAALIGKVGA